MTDFSTEALDTIADLMRSYEKEAYGFHLHLLRAYRNTVLLLDRHGYQYDSPEASRVREIEKHSQDDDAALPGMLREQAS